MKFELKVMGAMMIAGLTGCGGAAQKAAEDAAAASGNGLDGTYWACKHSDDMQMDVLDYVSISESSGQIEKGVILFDSVDGTCSGEQVLMCTSHDLRLHDAADPSYFL